MNLYTNQINLVPVVRVLTDDQGNLTLTSLSLPWLSPMKLFRRQRYVRESPHSVTLAQFRYNVANMGNKYPRVGRQSVQRDCPLCPQRERNSVAHLALFCSSIERIRKEQTTITSFRKTCIFKGFSEDYTFQLFINGLDWNENPVVAELYLDRGRELAILLEYWLSQW